MSCLQGLRVIDMTSVLMGPYATQILGDFGADVIKIEPPGGDTTRQIGPARSKGMSSGFIHCNRNKRSVCLDLKKKEGHDALLKLIETADILVYNVRPKAMERLALSWKDLSPKNPRLIHAGLVGYGRGGPYSDLPAYDDLIQAAIGLPSLIQQSTCDQPRYVPLAFVDRAVGLAAVNAILGALLYRARENTGQALEIPMFETMVPFVLGEHLGGDTFIPSNGPRGYARLLARERAPFATSDGHIGVVIYNDAHWRSFCKIINDPQLPETDPRLESLATRSRHIAELYAIAARHFQLRTSNEWFELLKEVDIPAMIVNDLQTLQTDPHLKATGYYTVHKHAEDGELVQMAPGSYWSSSPPTIQRLAPHLGEHTTEVLEQAGMSVVEIERLLDIGAAFEPKRKN